MDFEELGVSSIKDASGELDAEEILKASDIEGEEEKKVEVQRIINGTKDIVWLSEIGKEDIALAGGKGANLAELYNMGLPVPNAFIVTAYAFSNFFSEIKKEVIEKIKSTNIENVEELNKTAKEIQELIIKQRFPEKLGKGIAEAYERLSRGKAEEIEESIVSEEIKQVVKVGYEPCFVAVRSSATTEDLKTASFAGQQETFLNIKGKEALLEAIKKCWASLFTARAIYYREKRNFPHEKSLIAVIVQKQINSEKSGVTFTINPVTNNKKEIVIEAVFGLGEGIVSGTIEPDTYIIDKETLNLKEKRIGTKKLLFTRTSEGKTVKKEIIGEAQHLQVLEKREIKRLAEYGVKIENHYKWPQDIEWAIEAGQIYIVQSRPVTTIKEEVEEEKIEEENVLLKGLGASPGVAEGFVKIIHGIEELNKIKKGDILVTKMTNPDMVVAMQKASAIVTDEGGLTCHAAIVSREIGLPAVVGTKKATKVLSDGMKVIVDGKKGLVMAVGIGEVGEVEERKRIEEERIEEKEQEEISEISITGKKRKIKVKVNCDFESVAEKTSKIADGIGLLRIEFIIAQHGIHPAQYLREGRLEEYEKILYEGIKNIVKHFEKKPVWIRTSDIRTDEYTNLKGAELEPKEANPMLGMHGIRRGLKDEEILKSELKAIKRLAEDGYNVGVMFPFLISVEELKKAKEIIREIEMKNVAVGVMIETPAACQIIEELCQNGIDFISFGTNDLTQLTLGVDRNNENLAYLYNEMHPAVLREIERVIRTCKKYHVETSICGQAANNPEMIKFLVEMGIDSISISLDAFSEILPLVEE